MRALVVSVIFMLVLAAPAGAARLNPVERQAINRTLDAFVNSAVKRRSVMASYDLVTPSMRAGISRSTWAKGNLPVSAYPARGSTFHAWTVDFASPTDVGFELMIESRKSRSDSIVFTGEVKKIHGRWLIDSFNPSATFSGSGTVVGPHDFTAQSGGDGARVASLGSAWIALPAALLGAGVLLLVGWLLIVWQRNLRAARRYKPRPLEPIRVAKEHREVDAQLRSVRKRSR
jgi:hypothetical protein